VVIDICTPIELDRKLETLTPPDNTEYLSMDGEVVEEYEVIRILNLITLHYIYYINSVLVFRINCIELISTAILLF